MATTKTTRRRLGVRQVESFDCGPAAAVNALASRGVNRSLGEMRKLCGTTSAGTSVRGLMRGLSLVASSTDLTRPEMFHVSLNIGHTALAQRLESGVVILPFLTLKPWDHWVVALSSRADRVCVQDSAADDLRWPTWAELLQLWEGPAGPKAQVFGVAL